MQSVVETRARIPAAIAAIAAMFAFAPTSASALTFVQAIGLFHVVVGLLLAATLIIFATGVGLYIARLNTWPSHRETAIRVMEWAVTMLFVLIILIAIVNFFQRHSTIALTILAFVAIVAVAILIVRVAAQSKKTSAPARPGGTTGRPAR
ncbi:hypothetical protein A3A39_01520 [Candidatus Kaiserbacteria bacterium RIFCSPLOWO2_01_FULL_54_13]|uniref:Uncharacterized protein n=1 Tax=Candidatus Kaiserbacteria bacterium RIFCSPLOWO2_01_FULL_54_13 TaxID=1798512 RepID=A0A1F6F3X0_9BACT|nr:MAG: hypothetical protein A3A39_01520 [Candidatus Kaiserbacteria bacterium RIFCSPLOWO2_01_FULL_54_13]